MTESCFLNIGLHKWHYCFLLPSPIIIWSWAIADVPQENKHPEHLHQFLWQSQPMKPKLISYVETDRLCWRLMGHSVGVSILVNSNCKELEIGTRIPTFKWSSFAWGAEPWYTWQDNCRRLSPIETSGNLGPAAPCWRTEERSRFVLECQMTVPRKSEWCLFSPWFCRGGSVLSTKTRCSSVTGLHLSSAADLLWTSGRIIYLPQSVSSFTKRERMWHLRQGTRKVEGDRCKTSACCRLGSLGSGLWVWQAGCLLRSVLEIHACGWERKEAGCCGGRRWTATGATQPQPTSQEALESSQVELRMPDLCAPAVISSWIWAVPGSGVTVGKKGHCRWG